MYHFVRHFFSYAEKVDEKHDNDQQYQSTGNWKSYDIGCDVIRGCWKNQTYSRMQHLCGNQTTGVSKSKYVNVYKLSPLSYERKSFLFRELK